MNKKEFLNRLIQMYPSQFQGASGEMWIDEYNKILTAKFEVDFDKLWQKIREEYKYTTTPSTAWLKERMPQCKDENALEKREEYMDVEIIRNGYPYVYAVTRKDAEYFRSIGLKYKPLTDYRVLN